MISYYFTFIGHHLFSQGYIHMAIKTDDNDIAFKVARKTMFKKFGEKWGFQYKEKSFKDEPALKDMVCVGSFEVNPEGYVEKGIYGFQPKDMDGDNVLKPLDVRSPQEWRNLFIHINIDIAQDNKRNPNNSDPIVPITFEHVEHYAEQIHNIQDNMDQPIPYEYALGLAYQVCTLEDRHEAHMEAEREQGGGYIPEEQHAETDAYLHSMDEEGQETS